MKAKKTDKKADQTMKLAMQTAGIQKNKPMKKKLTEMQKKMRSQILSSKK